MGLFDKKYCDICGEKIGLLGNRKLDDGNLCKDCAARLSPFFSERRSSTVDQIREQLAYREENMTRLGDFHPTEIFGKGKKIYVDTAAQLFAITRASDFRKANPDLISFSQVMKVELNLREHKNEEFTKDKDGKRVSYNPRRFKFEYEFSVTLHVDSPWFNEITVELSEGARPTTRIMASYHALEQEGLKLKRLLTGAAPASAVKAPAPAPAPAPVPAGPWICPNCNAENEGKFCEYCGTARP